MSGASPAGPSPASPLGPDDWRRVRAALIYMGRDLHHRSYAVTAERRELLWQEMDACLALAERIPADGDEALPAGPAAAIMGAADPPAAHA
ncbi:hypothetical protein [Cyanobium sp. LEGE 06113]|uniref:hypothetical protein n=1 Tax=Cyanobium sp. LEGE 06113 TaxID=1297573 RepID=UPI001D15BEB2|nr:hypothetical protein [Cyanobium sp. LEGE 06113]